MDRKDGLRDKLDTLDEEELKDIIELQLEEIHNDWSSNTGT